MVRLEISGIARRLVGILGWPVEHSLSPRDAQRRVRRARARLGVRRAADAARAPRGRRPRARRARLRGRERHDAAQARRHRASARRTRRP